MQLEAVAEDVWMCPNEHGMHIILPGLHMDEIPNVNIWEAELFENSLFRNTLIVMTFWSLVFLCTSGLVYSARVDVCLSSELGLQIERPF